MIDFAEVPLLAATLIAMGVSLILMILIPVLPGQFLIWLAALVYGILSGWEDLGGSTFFWLTLLMIVAAIIDFIAGWIGARKGGASWPGIAIGLGLGFLGLIIFNAIGAIAGVLIGIVGYEYYIRDEEWRDAWRAGMGYLGGLLVSLAIRFVISIGMVIIFFTKVT